MRLGSVRLRLTALVVLISAVVAVLAATVGTSRVEQSLVDDVLDEAAFEQIGFLEDFVAVEEELLEELGPVQSAFVLAGEVEFLEASLADLDDVGELDALLAAASTDRTAGLPVLTNFGPVVVIGVDGRDSVPLDVDVEQVDGPLVAQVTVEVLGSSLFEPDFEDLDAELFEDFDLEPGDVDYVYGERDVGELTFVVGADVTDVRRSVDRIRGVLWLAAPVLIVLGAVVAWLLTGRALRPVDRITEQVGVISTGRLHQRVPEPRSGDEIDRLAVTMNAMLDRLEADDRRLRRFVSDASHELRSPVAVLRSEAEVALRRPDDTPVDRLAADVLAESTRLQRIVEDLLVLAQGDERHGGNDLRVVDLDDLVLAEAGRHRRVPVDTSAVSAGRVRATPEIGERILAHLLDNAARHAAAAVAVGLATRSGQVELRVDDDGHGVPPDERARVFERFTRLDAARTRDTGGAGLGLAVVAELVTALDGTVECTDSPLGGARFVVRLPSAAEGGESTG